MFESNPFSVLAVLIVIAGALWFIFQAFAREDKDEEACVACRERIPGLPRDARVDDPRRFAEGRQYIDGSGQVCSACASSLLTE